MTTVFVRGLEFYGHHGVHAAERLVGHRFRLDLELSVDETAQKTDDLDDTVNYAAAAVSALEVCKEGECLTVERLARKIGERLLADHARIQTARVRVAKLLPPADIMCDEVGVELVVGRMTIDD